MFGLLYIKKPCWKLIYHKRSRNFHSH